MTTRIPRPTPAGRAPTTDAAWRPGRGAGLATRLFVALAIVVMAGALTAWLVAGVLGPPIFHDHLVQAGLAGDSAALLHAEEAYRTASTLSLSIAVAAAVLTSLGVSVFLTARIGRSLASLTTAASHVAGGRYEARVPPPAMGTEFDHLATAFNQMAGRLESSERLRRRLLSDIAHELRTPVATLDAYLEALEDGVTVLEPRTVEVLRTQVLRLTRLAEDLAAVTHAESGDLSLRTAPTAPADLVAGAVASAAERYAAAGVALTDDVAPGLPDLVVDSERMAQVLGNLLENALRHTPAGSAVHVAAGATYQGVILSVSDRGDGIAAEHLPHVFERFYRADDARDRTHGGSGIGLAITRALVEAHGGTVAAWSEGPGMGARFDVVLPVDR
jgi:signal transduction histidine kinase